MSSAAIDMGAGVSIQLSDMGDGRWKLDFGTATAPALDAFKVEAIDRKGQCHAMKMFPGPSTSSVYASGPTEQAYRARVALTTDGQIRRRDIDVPAGPGFNLVRGPNSGTLISMGHDSYVEVLPQGDARWKIVFMDKDVLARAPVVADVKAEAIGSALVDTQIRDLTIVPGEDASSLFVAGPVADATHLRLAVMMGDHYHTRCVPVLRP